jgi:hypothetical protein
MITRVKSMISFMKDVDRLHHKKPNPLSYTLQVSIVFLVIGISTTYEKTNVISLGQYI